MDSIDIEDTNVKILLVKEINYLINDFFKNIGETDIKIYFMNKDIILGTDFNKWIIKKLSDVQINFLKENIKYSVNCLKNININLVNKNKNLNYDLWKLCIFDNMFFNLPFTLDDIIFIPISYINSSMNKTGFFDNINKSFSKTLVHEKIHLLQRYNEDLWDKYILENTKWIITDKQLIMKCCLINNNKIIYNPDTFYVKNKFVYEKNNKKYFGLMLLNSKNEIKNIWFQVVEINNIINLYPVPETINNYEHPYEELAYGMASELISK